MPETLHPRCPTSMPINPCKPLHGRWCPSGWLRMHRGIYNVALVLPQLSGPALVTADGLPVKFGFVYFAQAVRKVGGEVEPTLTLRDRPRGDQRSGVEPQCRTGLGFESGCFE